MTRADRSAGVLIVLSLALALAVSFSRRVDAQFANFKIALGLRQQIRWAGRGTYVVILAQRANLTSASSIADWSDRGFFVYDTLLSTARTSQAGLLAFLEAELDAGNVTRFQPFFIINAVEVTSSLHTLDRIAARPEVSRIVRPSVARLHDADPSAKTADVVTLGTTPGLDIIGAPDVWADFGTRGEGIVVANIDSGVQFDHPALVNQYRGTATGSHDFNFYDPTGLCGGTPCDNNNHGTHTMGTMVGDDGGTNQIGVAPGAKWIAAKGCASSSCSSNALLRSGEWMLAPCAFGDEPGDPSCNPSLRPHVINNSWGGPGGDTFYQATVNAWRMAGIIPVFSAGNSGPGSGTMGSPGNYCNVIGVGATDLLDVVASFSSRGPGTVACGQKPDVSAPGVHTRSSIPTDSYRDFQGTSMAAPHVAGCTALLLSIDPGLSYAQIYGLLTTTAVDYSHTGFDFDYGFGRIDCRAAAGGLNAASRRRLASRARR
jgi:subtilisin family serine protease